MQSTLPFGAPGRDDAQLPSATTWSDEDIEAAIRFAAGYIVPSLDLACEVHDGIAILRGHPADYDERLRALDMSADVPGVRHVIDRLASVRTPKQADGRGASALRRAA
jgi:osmotically-inducible protein OsmY